MFYRFIRLVLGIAGSFAVALCAASSVSPSRADERPNILMILVDDK